MKTPHVEHRCPWCFCPVNPRVLAAAREVLTLGCTQMDAAQRYGVPQGSVGNKLAQARDAQGVDDGGKRRAAASPDERLREALRGLLVADEAAAAGNHTLLEGAFDMARLALAAADREAPDGGR